MLFYVLLIACAIPLVFLLFDFFNQHKANKEKEAVSSAPLSDSKQQSEEKGSDG